MSDRLKLFPAVIAALVLMCGLKLVNIWTGVSTGLTTAAVAQEAEEIAPEEAAGEDTGPAEEGEGAETAAVVEDAEPARDLSAAEEAVLRSLAERREALTERESNLEVREKLIIAAEARVEERITELKQIESNIEDLLGKRDAAEVAQIESLKKVYERMKPKDAARIFETLDKDILLDVSARMKEQSLGSILAQMSPGAAQELTVRLAQRHALPDETALSSAQ